MKTFTIILGLDARVEKYSHAEFGSVSSIFSKKSAMFGLDARIALAIFGALSIITGAALYSALQSVKATALLTEMNNVGKAYESFMVDTGRAPERYTQDMTKSLFYTRKLRELVENPGLVGWKGPYSEFAPAPEGGGEVALVHSEYGGVFVRELTDVNWPVNTNGVCKTAGESCGAWIMINGIDDDSMAKILDKKIDSGDGASAGDFRWWTDGSEEFKYRYYYKYMPIKNIHD